MGYSYNELEEKYKNLRLGILGTLFQWKKAENYCPNLTKCIHDLEEILKEDTLGKHYKEVKQHE